MDVVVWLRSLGLEEYEAAFRDNKINERVLPSLTAEDLKELGVAARLAFRPYRGATFWFKNWPPRIFEYIDSATCARTK